MIQTEIVTDLNNLQIWELWPQVDLKLILMC
jgi:hypothetical protein